MISVVKRSAIQRVNGSSRFMMRSNSSLAGKNLMSIIDLSSEQLEGLIQHSIDIKTAFKTDPSAARQLQPLKGVSMSMIFQKRC
jgi:ornithine carbamoyltransferase